MKLKDQVKIYLFPALVSFLHMLGFSWKKLSKLSFFNKSIMLAQANTLGKFEIENTDKIQAIYVLTLLSDHPFQLYIEALLALGLKKKGHKITFIIDDNTLPIQEFKRLGNESSWDSATKANFDYTSKFLNRLNLNYSTVSEFIKDAPKLEYHEKYDPILEASLLKHYKVGVISDDLPDINNRIKLFKKAIAITNYIGEKLVALNVDKIIMNHGIYSTWGPPFQVLDAHDVPILVHSRARKKYAQVFNWNKTGDSWDVSEEWDRVKNKELKKSELDKINSYLDSRISHKDDVFVFSFGKETSKLETISNLGLDANKPICTLFTNVLWDAASAQREIAFKNSVEWVIETIEWFNEHPERQLIVKIHPAEIILGTKMPFYDIITSRVTPNNNVKIIKPDVKVNSWSIYKITDLGLVHTTTSGMELPLLKKPCIVVSKTHYRGKGFTIDINSKEEYFDIIENFDLKNYDLVKNEEEALKYAYLLFIRYQMPFEMFIERKPSDLRGYKFQNIEDYFNYPQYSGILAKIIDKQPIFN